MAAPRVRDLICLEFVFAFGSRAVFEGNMNASPQNVYDRGWNRGIARAKKNLRAVLGLDVTVRSPEDWSRHHTGQSSQPKTRTRSRWSCWAPIHPTEVTPAYTGVHVGLRGRL